MMRKNALILFTSIFFVFGCKKNNDVLGEDTGSLPDNYVSAIYVDNSAIKYFATGKGLAGFDGEKWTVYSDNLNLGISKINDFGFENSDSGSELWLATNQGLKSVKVPVDEASEITTYTKNTSSLAGDSVSVIKVDVNNYCWLGTDQGLSVLKDKIWPEIDPKNYYDDQFFITNRITSFGYNNDTVYIGTKGGGVARMVSGPVDAVTGASPFEIPWSFLASNNVLAVYTDGNTQWFGTDEGVTKHVGTRAKQNWQSYFKEDGLVDNNVQCIVKDLGGNMWFGTKGGVSVFDGFEWDSFTKSDGLVANNVLCIAVDIDGSLWFGTDAGVSHFKNNRWENYSAK
ncbi:MAG: two-component regulator propeller domain-containing protein [Draconibacterium sp.]